MHRALTTLSLLVLTLLLAACDQQALIDRIVPKAEVEVAQKFVAQVAAREFDPVIAALAPQYKTPAVTDSLKQMADLWPAGAPVKVTTVGSQTVTSGDQTRYNFTFEYQFASSWVLVTTELQRQGDVLSLNGIHFTPRTQSMAAESAFSFAGKGPLHYVFLVLAAAIPLFVLYVFVLCIRTRGITRKWLWLLFIAMGLVQFQFNWATGLVSVKLLSFLLLGAGFMKPLYGPLVLTIAVPVGAIVFLLRRHTLQRVERQAAAGTAPEYAVTACRGGRLRHGLIDRVRAS